MWLWFFWAFLIASAHPRPQSYQFDQHIPNEETQPEDILHVTTFNTSIRDDVSQRKIEENTREILEKIEELNKKQGLTKKKKPSYFHFPFSYSRSQEDTRNVNNNFRFPVDSQYIEHEKRTAEDRGSTSPIHDGVNFKFPTNPFQNPILQYLENQQDIPTQLKSSSAPLPAGGVSIFQTNPNAEITEEDKIPGQYVKRKITHQQTMIVPSIQTYINNQFNPAFQQYMQNGPSYEPTNPQVIINQYVTQMNQKESGKKPNSKVSSLEKQTINNIKNIIFNSQPNPSYFNPYAPNVQSNYQPVYGMPHMFHNGKTGTDYNENQPISTLYGPYVVPNLAAASMTRQFQFQSPLQDYFPVVIKDPFVQLFNAYTSMVEYGPQASGGAMDSGCKNKENSKKQSNEEVDVTPQEGTGIDRQSEFELSQAEQKQKDNDFLTYNIEHHLDSLVLKNFTKDENVTLILEASPLSYNETNRTSINLRSPKGKIQEKIATLEKVPDSDGNLKLSQLASNYNIKENKVELARPQYVRISPRPHNKDSTTPKITLSENILKRGNSPPRRDPILYDDEAEIEDEKRIGKPTPFSPYSTGEDLQLSHDGNKKLFSKDNTGSGIFIHKLKVRRGGVAIAGPGGIATAGEGGTAIVGPNGYAYTQPDSLAIAGTGTKVIAVEPTINLSDLVKNKTKFGGPNPQRVGKLVAVGPVIYYNKG